MLCVYHGLSISVTADCAVGGLGYHGKLLVQLLSGRYPADLTLTS